MELVKEESRHSLQENMHRITSPVQVIWGKEDEVMMPRSETRLLFHTVAREKSTVHLHVQFGKCRCSVRRLHSQVLHMTGAAVLQAALPNCQVDLVDNCGHSVSLERPRKTAKLIMDFLTAQGGGTKKSL